MCCQVGQSVKLEFPSLVAFAMWLFCVFRYIRLDVVSILCNVYSG